MANCRSISPEIWEHARQALIMFFSRRHKFDNAEDLAQETLTALWSRPDFEFDKDEEFLRVCYGFAGKISLAGYRTAQKHDAEPLETASPRRPCLKVGLNPVEATLLLDEVLRIAKAELRDQDWQLIETAAMEEGVGAARPRDLKDANRARVGLFRARRKLKELTGWGK